MWSWYLARQMTKQFCRVRFKMPRTHVHTDDGDKLTTSLLFAQWTLSASILGEPMHTRPPAKAAVLVQGPPLSTHKRGRAMEPRQTTTTR